jgi:sugar lactone lactonase YvrE
VPVNGRARTLEVVPVPATGAEDVVVGTHGRHEGAVFTGTEDGSIWRVSHDRRRIDRVAGTGGRPLGLEHDADGRLVVCDAHRGLLRVDPDTGATEVLADRVDGVPLLVTNNAALAADGTIWFSDSSTVHPLEEWRRDFGRHTRTGRLLRRDPDGGVEVVLDGLAFANGVTLAADESFVTVAESGGRTVVRHWLAGARAGETDLLADDLPGYPDNTSLGSDGLIWVTIASPAVPVVALMHRSPRWVRVAMTSLPQRLQPQPRRTVRVQAYAADGSLVHDLDLPATDFHMVTGVREHDGTVWMGSLHEAAIAATRL